MVICFGSMAPAHGGPEDVMDDFIANAKRDGTVYVQEWSDGTPEKTAADYDSLYRMKLNLQGCDCEALKAEYRKVYETLVSLAEKKRNKKRCTAEERQFKEKWLAKADTSTVNKKLTELWETKLEADLKRKHREEAASFEAFESDWLKELQEHLAEFSPEQLEAAEKEYEKYVQVIFEDACARLGSCLWQRWHEAGESGEEPVCTAYELHIRARRVLQLLQLKAPAFIVEGEAEILAANLFLHHTLEAMETVRL